MEPSVKRERTIFLFLKTGRQRGKKGGKGENL